MPDDGAVSPFSAYFERSTRTIADDRNASNLLATTLSKYTGQRIQAVLKAIQAAAGVRNAALRAEGVSVQDAQTLSNLACLADDRAIPEPQENDFDIIVEGNPDNCTPSVPLEEFMKATAGEKLPRISKMLGQDEQESHESFPLAPHMMPPPVGLPLGLVKYYDMWVYLRKHRVSISKLLGISEEAGETTEVLQMM